MRITSFYGFITIALLTFFLISCAKNAETGPVTKPANPAVISDTITKCEALFKQRGEDPAKLREAVKSLAAIRNPDQRNFEVEWKFSKFNFFLGKETTDDKEREKAFDDGVQSGKIASRIDPNKPEGYFWYGANLGEQSRLNPVTVGVKSVDDIKEAMNKVIEIQPNYQNGSAYDGLAQVELSTAGVMGGDPQKAVEYLEKALTIDHNNTYIYLHLAQAFLATGKKAEAKKQLEHLLQMKPDPDYLPEYNETVQAAKKMLETKF